METKPTKSHISDSLKSEKQRTDLGFGSKITDSESRLINPDGTFNVERIKTPFWSWLNPFHRLTTMSWPLFLLIVFLTFFLTNVFFSTIYILIGTEHLVGMLGVSKLEHFWEAFYFSAQTLTTVGYGRISPIGHLTSAVAAVEALVGLLAFALATGLLYGRFSRPKPRILFSKNALIVPYNEINAFMFRIINLQQNELLDIRAEVSLTRVETKADSTKLRKYYTLELERKQVNFFPLSWTVVHPITDKSPLFGETAESMANSDAEFLVYLKATEESFLQNVSVRASYRFNQLVWGAKFVPMFDGAHFDGKVKLDVNSVHNFENVKLNVE